MSNNNKAERCEITVKDKGLGDLFIYLFIKGILEAFAACHAPMQFNETLPLSQGKLG